MLEKLEANTPDQLSKELDMYRTAKPFRPVFELVAKVHPELYEMFGEKAPTRDGVA